MLLKSYFTYEITLKDNRIIQESGPNESPAFRFEERNPDFKDIKRFRLIPKTTSLHPVEVTIPEGGRLIYFRRTVKNLSVQFPDFHIYLLGVQRTIKGRNEKEIVFIFPDGTTELSFEDQPFYEFGFIKSLTQAYQNGTLEAY